MQDKKEESIEKLSKQFKKKLIDDSYAIIPIKRKDDLIDYYYQKDPNFYNTLNSYGIKFDKRGSNYIYYEFNKVLMYYADDLFELLKEIYGEEPINHNLIFRGHANANYQLFSSLIRNEKELQKDLENESKYYFDTIRSNPEAFRKARYHLDYLKTIQHYRGKTRIMDISTNVLITIYFAVEKTPEDKNRLHMGELIIFDREAIDRNKHVSETSETAFVADQPRKTGNNSVIEPKVEGKRFNSDTVEILASLAALDKELKDNIKEEAQCLINKYGTDEKVKKQLVEEFNKSPYVQKLIHEVGQVRLNFKDIIDPSHLFNIYFSDSTFDNERITNQAGEFIIHGFIKAEKMNEKLNEFRLKESNKTKIILIDDTAKPKIREQLKMLKVKQSTIYPSLENTVTDIYF